MCNESYMRCKDTKDNSSSFETPKMPEDHVTKQASKWHQNNFTIFGNKEKLQERVSNKQAEDNG